MERPLPISGPEIPDSTSKTRTAMVSVLAAAVMAILKLWAGLASGSIGMLSEAAHSGLDLIASIIILASVTVSDRPADEAHSYGHGKIENLAAFTETLLMVVSVIWILTEAAERIVRHAETLRLSIWPFAVLLLSMLVDFLRSRALSRTARKTRSQALEADAWHFSMDIWSSLAVIGGLLCGAAAQRWHLQWLRLGDPLAAVAVSIIILKVCWRLARQTANVLTDAVPIEVRHKVTEAVRQVPDVMGIERVRIRVSGNHYFADLTVGMERNLSFQRTEQIKGHIAETVLRELPDADVIVNVIPRASGSESVFDRVRAVVSRHNLAVHELNVLHQGGKLHLEQHLEVPESLSLRDAHALVTAIEAETRTDVPEIDSILTHIESERGTIESEDSRSGDARIETELRRIAAEFPDILDVHDIAISSEHDRMRISCHCTLPDDRSMADVHALITAFEDKVKAEMPNVSRVFIHPEPATDNAR